MIKNLRLLRTERGLSQASLAELMGTTQQAIYNYEKDNNEPSIYVLKQLAGIFDVSIDYLLGLTEIRTINPTIHPVTLTDDEELHLSRWRKNSPEYRERLDALIDIMAKEQES